jgi:hypothetical protein
VDDDPLVEDLPQLVDRAHVDRTPAMVVRRADAAGGRLRRPGGQGRVIDAAR